MFLFQEQSNTVQMVLDILQWIVPPMMDTYQDASPLGSTGRAQKALNDLHMQAKKIETTADQLMVLICLWFLIHMNSVYNTACWSGHIV